MTSATVGAILIGGSSTRMGEDKAAIELAGTSMAHWVARAMSSAGLDVVTIGGPDRVVGYPNVPDPEGAHGPLAGLQGALEHSGSRPVFVAGVDQPLLKPDTIRRIVEIHTHDVVIPEAGGHPQVTCALYRATCLPAIRQITPVNPNASIRDLLAYVTVRTVEESEWAAWGEDGSSWRSIDTPGDLEAVRRHIGDG